MGLSIHEGAGLAVPDNSAATRRGHVPWPRASAAPPSAAALMKLRREEITEFMRGECRIRPARSRAEKEAVTTSNDSMIAKRRAWSTKKRRAIEPNGGDGLTGLDADLSVCNGSIQRWGRARAALALRLNLGPCRRAERPGTD